MNLGGANSDLLSHHLHIDGSKGSKTTVNLIKSLKDSTWYGRGVSVLSSLVINIISCNYIGVIKGSQPLLRPTTLFIGGIE